MRKFILLLLIGVMIPSLCFGAAATMYVTVAGASGKDGTDWANAFGYAEWETDLEGSAEAGDIYYIEEGTYTFTSTLAPAKAGTAVAPISIIGVLSGTTNEPPVLTDYATGANRPIMATGNGNYMYTNGAYWVTKNLSYTGTGTYLLLTGANSLLVNCKGNNVGGARAFHANNGEDIYIGCEMQANAGVALNIANGVRAYVIDCYIHDSVDGLGTSALPFESFGVAINNVIDTCTSGINLASEHDVRVIGNTIYNCTTGIVGTAAYNCTFLNNIIDACTTGASWSTNELINFWDYNVWDNGTDATNVTKGLNAITGDPAMTAPATGNFVLQAGSNALDAGLDAGTNTSATT